MLLIAAKDLRLLLRDRATLIIMVIAPLVITFIAGMAFSGFNKPTSPIQNIPVVIVNKDKGAEGSPNYGVQFTSILTNKNIAQLADLLKAKEETDESAARKAVKEGKYVAAIIIPEDFTASLDAAAKADNAQKVHLEFYRDAGSGISADIVLSITHSFIDTFMTSSIGTGAFKKLVPNANPLQLSLIGPTIASKLQSEFPLTVNTSANGQAQSFNLLQFFAPSMAVFFLNFTMVFGVLSIMEERDKGTLQRMLISPTSRLTILAGKFIGTYFQGVLQLTVLILATTIIAPMLGYGNSSVWGTNIPALVLMVLLVTGASIGLGTLLVAIAKDRQQAAFLANAVMILLGIVGGTFFGNTSGQPPVGPISYLSINYWANYSFFNLASSNVLPVTNILALAAIFVVTFGVGITLFSRRADI